ncbi:MAG: ribosome maturation factor RimM [Leptospirillia bacterium]
MRNAGESAGAGDAGAVGSGGADSLVCVGIKVRPHGIRGEVRVDPLSEQVGRFVRGLAVIWRGRQAADRSLTVAAVRGKGGTAYLKFDEIADRTAAEALSGGSLWAEGATSPALEEGVYYHHQLIGLSVSDEAGAPIGRLTAVLEGSAHDNYEITCDDGQRFLMPAVSAFVRLVDVAGGRMTIRPIPGLLPEPKPDDG